MPVAIFNFNAQKTLINLKENEKMKDICNKFLSRYEIDLDSVNFLYNGKLLNLDLTFRENANQIDLERGEMNILVYLVYESNKKSFKNNNIIVRSKEIICPECDENCRISIKDYKVKTYECKNGHQIDDMLLNEFYNTQFISESKIICSICKKSKANGNKFSKCLQCKNNICFFCKLSHDNSHTMINYEIKNYLCYIHNSLFNSYCYICKENLCEKCQSKHNGHNIKKYENILENEYKIKEDLGNFRKKIDELNETIKVIIKILKNVEENIELYYQINSNIINNYKKEYTNYQILQNINEIQNIIKLSEIDEIINDNNYNYKFRILFDLYSKINQRELIENNNCNK